MRVGGGCAKECGVVGYTRRAARVLITREAVHLSGSCQPPKKPHFMVHISFSFLEEPHGRRLARPTEQSESQ